MAFAFGMKPDRRASSPARLVHFPGRECNGAFGLAARAGERAADQRAGQKAEWSGGWENGPRERPLGEPSLAGWGGVVCKGKPHPASLGDGESGR
jgi:hypothetical protein